MYLVEAYGLEREVVMSLIKCPECGKEISDRAPACIYCGCPINVKEYNINSIIELVNNMFQGKWYWGDDEKKLHEYLDKIVMYSSDGLNIVRELLRKNKIYEIAEERIKKGLITEGNSNPNRSLDEAIANILTKYDAHNYLGWLVDYRSSCGQEHIISGDNVIKYAPSPMKEVYEKEIYLERLYPAAENSSERIKTVPKQYIDDNIFVQDAIIERMNRYLDHPEQTLTEKDREFINLLPESRRCEVKVNISNRPSKSNSSSDGCYIATCVYGSYDCPQVWTLRRFRDCKLKTTWYGRLFVKFYYAVSPVVVKRYGNIMWLRTMWKSILDKMVYKLNNKGFDNTPYADK